MQKNTDQKITIVGTGLVGSLLSIFLAKRGLKVDAYERRPDMRKETISAGRSINLAISVRGIHALKQVGLENEISQMMIPMRGRMIHPKAGTLAFQPYGMSDSDCINSISRGDLNKVLMNAAEKSGVQIHFNERATGFDPKTGAIELMNEKSQTSTTKVGDFAFGTDGSASALRHQLASLPGYKSTESHLEHGYKELVLPAGPKGSFQLEKNALHIWPRGNYMLIALPNFDGSFTCTLFLPNEGPLSFQSLKTPEQVLTFFKEEFSDIVPLMPKLAEVYFENPTGHMYTVKSFPWNYKGTCLLLGDAAHGIVPFFGQGMNAGFEDCTVLDQALEKATSNQKPLNWEKIAVEVAEARKPNTDAIADLAVENFVEMRDKTGSPQFLLEKEVERILQREFPRDYLSRYSMVSFSRIPYQIAYEAGLIQAELLTELCHGLKNSNQLDLSRAGELIRQKLSPWMRAKFPV